MSDDDYVEDKWIDEPSLRMSKDLREAAANLQEREVKYIVSVFYQWQSERKRSNSRILKLEEFGEPHGILQWLKGHSNSLENQIKLALAVYVDNEKEIAPWLKSVVGIGPVLAAGLISHTIMNRWCGYKSPKGVACRGVGEEDCARRQADKKKKLPKHTYTPEIALPTVGRLYSHIGWAADNQRPWVKGQLRPWNAEFKTLCYKIGQSFVYQSNHPRCVYGHIYKERKAYEIARNNSGLLADQAAKKLRDFNIGKDTDAYKYYSSGRLPPAHIDARARRYAVKRFLADFHEQYFTNHFGEPPPWPMGTPKPPVTP